MTDPHTVSRTDYLIPSYETLKADRDRLAAHLKTTRDALDAIRRAFDPNGCCLETCACNRGDDDCDCGYCEAEYPGDYAAGVLEATK